MPESPEPGATRQNDQSSGQLAGPASAYQIRDHPGHRCAPAPAGSSFQAQVFLQARGGMISGKAALLIKKFPYVSESLSPLLQT